MKTRILILVMFIGFWGSVAAQQGAPRKTGLRPGMKNQVAVKAENHLAGLNLTDEQKEAFKKSFMALQKQMQPLRNELGEAMARQKSLTTVDKPDLNAINKNLEKIGDLKTEMAKLQARHRIDLRSQLNDEQKLKFDHHGRGMRKGESFRGMHGQRYGRMPHRPVPAVAPIPGK